MQPIRHVAPVARFALLSLVVLAGPLAAQAQQASAPKTLVFTTTSEEARAAAYDAAVQVFNIHFPRAASSARRAMAADPNLGMARALYVMANPPELTPAQGAAELDRAVADGARASVQELLATAAIRSIVLNRPERDALLDALITLLPEDPVPPYLRAVTRGDAATRRSALEDVAKRFPAFGPGWNVLAYARTQTGDTTGGFAAAERYVRLMPDHPNPHDTYGELLRLAGRFDQALSYYQRALELDPTFGGGPTGVAMTHMLLGHPAEARAAWTRAAELSLTPTGKLAARAQAALTYLLEGNAKAAVAGIALVAADAERQGLKGPAASYHTWIAATEANFGDRGAVEAHLAKVRELAGASAPVTLRAETFAYVATGKVEMARAAAAKFDELNANAAPVVRQQAHELNAMVAAVTKDFELARRELAQAGPFPNWGRAVLAVELAKAGRKADAQALKAAIMASGSATAVDVAARAKVRTL